MLIISNIRIYQQIWIISMKLIIQLYKDVRKSSLNYPHYRLNLLSNGNNIIDFLIIEQYGISMN